MTTPTPRDVTETVGRRVGSGSSERRRARLRSPADTTEIRWFLPGRLPAEVRRWFTGSTGVGEERCDTYLLTGSVDEGLKYRGGETLERKVRREIGPWIDLGDRLTGVTEEWRKWTPADDPVETSRRWRPVDVHKVIVKRRFALDGTEEVFSPDQHDGPACDVEIADVRADAVTAWTLAFAAFGPTPMRCAALLACWEGLKASSPGYVPLEPAAGSAMSYPEWLARSMNETPQVRSGTSGSRTVTCER